MQAFLALKLHWALPLYLSSITRYGRLKRSKTGLTFQERTWHTVYSTTLAFFSRSVGDKHPPRSPSVIIISNIAYTHREEIENRSQACREAQFGRGDGMGNHLFVQVYVRK